MWVRMQRKGHPLKLLVGMQNALWKIVWRFLKKLKIELLHNTAITLLGIYPKDTKIVIQRGTCTPMFVAALSTIAKIYKESKSPLTDEQINMYI